MSDIYIFIRQFRPIRTKIPSILLAACCVNCEAYVTKHQSSPIS